MGYIHACSLRWSLQREGNLDFNSNLRLLTASRHSRPNSAVPNAIYLIGIILAYGSTSLIFLSLNPELARLLGKDYDHSDTQAVHANTVALITFGIGFLLQAVITSWTLLQTDIPTWSSNPLDVARACTVDEHDGQRVEPRIGRCMMSAHLAMKDARSCRPRRRQRPMITAHSHVKWILSLLWLLPLLSGSWGGAAYGYLLKGHRNSVFGRSWSLLPVFTGKTDSNCSTGQCTDGTSVINLNWSAKGAAGTVGGVFMITAIQSIVTLSLHCAELLVNLSRDEKVFRELIGPRGTNGHYNSILAAFTSWQTIVLFALKAIVHWIFGLAINLQFQIGVNMHPPQIFYFAGISLVTAIFGLSLSLQRPRGYLPASYGHIQTIADIVDDWADSGCMFWGEKDPGSVDKPGYTGTSTRRLKQPDENKLYGGLEGCRGAAPRVTVTPFSTPDMHYPLSASSGSPPPMYFSGGAPSPPPPYGYAAPGQGRGQQQVHSYAQWAAYQPQNRPSYNSLNSAYSWYSGYSGQSTQPFLSDYRRM
jgi:hypothetical protein